MLCNDYYKGRYIVSVSVHHLLHSCLCVVGVYVYVVGFSAKVYMCKMMMYS